MARSGYSISTMGFEYPGVKGKGLDLFSGIQCFSGRFKILGGGGSRFGYGFWGIMHVVCARWHPSFVLVGMESCELVVANTVEIRLELYNRTMTDFLIELCNLMFL